MYEESLATCEKVAALYGSSPFSGALPSLDFVGASAIRATPMTTRTQEQPIRSEILRVG